MYGKWTGKDIQLFKEQLWMGLSASSRTCGIPKAILSTHLNGKNKIAFGDSVEDVGNFEAHFLRRSSRNGKKIPPFIVFIHSVLLRFCRFGYKSIVVLRGNYVALA